MLDESDLNRQVGEIAVSNTYMREQLQTVIEKLDHQQQAIDAINLQIAEFRGAKRLTEWMRSIVAGIIGAAASILSIIMVFWGQK